MQGMISNPETALKFMLAGNAIVTVRSQKSGVYFTYKISLLPKRGGDQHTKHLVKLLTGPDNENDYSPLGLLIEGRLFPTKKARTTGINDSTP
jgi:hypothetical protein